MRPSTPTLRLAFTSITASTAGTHPPNRQSRSQTAVTVAETVSSRRCCSRRPTRLPPGTLVPMQARSLPRTARRFASRATDQCDHRG
jgi:hypothetical protein